ncbi:MAG: hypothetical protein Q8P59_09245 [Dehalococcoidia bacterium]|nr:hypothetical protein [Dehalococcoidia bacterium]
MAFHPMGELEEAWSERGRRAIELSTPTEEQVQVEVAKVFSLTPAEASRGRHDLLWSASARHIGKVSVFGAISCAVRIDGWPIGRVKGGRGKKERVKALVEEHYQKRAATSVALDRRLSVGERPESMAAEVALDQLTPPEAHRLIALYLAKLERRGK